MVQSDNAHSRIVGWLKILLPLLALAILSTLFLVAESFDPEAAIPYAERTALDEIIEEQRVGAPSFSGVSADGTAIIASAETVRPDGSSGQITGETLSARFDFPSAGTVTLTSPTGRIDDAQRTLRFEGGARVASSTGYSIETDAMTGALDGAFLRTDGKVEANGPTGQITAGRMRLERAASGTYLLRFTDGVRLVYDPES